MSRIYRAIKYVKRVPTEIHVFPLVEQGTSEYRALLSVGAFETRMLKICMDADTTYYHLMRQHEWETDRLYRDMLDEMPVVQHRDLSAFYSAVGWDYKKKKFA